ncbi:putative membrane protein YccC [Roseibium hamelinense]|uniref:Putative membrane protein YccC n=1 Tax=Roseibium hamelinense TaxID=150831 RepID=A0A562TB66_9HYPH|nr:FUSC family protein [Roseibium hamelinense]MTI45490.1 hypothetical protein [Roseibium hamelinense]TWI90136.1 putative membrane protein YccC [Roseibium hamelinense]
MRKIQGLDPGGLRLVRGFRLVAGMMGAGVLGTHIGALLPALRVPDLSVVCAVVALLLQVFTQPASRTIELAHLWINGAVFTGILSLSVPIRLVVPDGHDLILQILWVFVIAFGFFLRRYGPFFERLGILVALAWLLIVGLHPPMHLAVWFPLAGLVSVCVVSVLVAILPRPSPIKVLRLVERSLGRALANNLIALARGDVPSADRQAQILHALKEKRSELTLAVESAARAGAIETPEPSIILSRSSKQILALSVVMDALEKLSEVTRAELLASEVFQAAIKEVVTVTRGGKRSGALPELSQSAWLPENRERSRTDRFRFLRLYQGLKRLSLIATAENVEPAQAGIPLPRGVSAAPHISPSARLALQGGLAAGITVAIGHVLDLKHAYWTTMTVILVLSNSLGQTLRRSIERVAGTVIGVGIAFGAFVFWQQAPDVLGALALAAFMFIFIAMERSYMAGSIIIGFCAVLGLHLVSGIGTAGMLERVYDTAIGAAAGFVVSILVFPIKTDTRIKTGLESLLSEAKRLVSSRAAEEANSVKAGRVLVANVSSFAAQLSTFRDEQVVLSATTIKSREFLASLETLADYTALFCQSRFIVIKNDELSGYQPLLDDLEAALVAAFDAARSGKPVPDVEAVADNWRDHLPLDDESQTVQLAELVNLVYFARKIVAGLTSLTDDPIFRFILR